MQKILEIKHGIARNDRLRLNSPIDFSLVEREPLTICGSNGSGKSLFAGLLTGAFPLQVKVDENKVGAYIFNKDARGHIRSITFNDVYGATPPAYYQQRWNHGDDMTFPLVSEVLRENAVHKELIASLFEALDIDSLLNKRVNQLSSGELRRFQLARTLKDLPSVLVVDNPYIGLDVETRNKLTNVLKKLSEKIVLILVVCRPTDIPEFIHRVIHVEAKTIFETTRKEEVINCSTCSKKSSSNRIPKSNGHNYQDIPIGEPLVELSNINLSYGERVIFKNLNLTIKSGEKWAITGSNGAGKTTLLSLLLADNPISYALNIKLFGKRRGSGESIWDIKKRIGYISPEIFSTYKKPLSVLRILSSGLHDTIGLYHKPTQEEENVCKEWLDCFEATYLTNRQYLELSHGEQRLILLIRAFVKSPQLLILDEPFHGLDNVWCQKAKDIICRYVNADKKRTLIMVSHYKEELPSCIDHHYNLIKQ